MFKMPHKFNKDVTKSERDKIKQAFIVKSFLTNSFKTLAVHFIVQFYSSPELWKTYSYQGISRW